MAPLFSRPRSTDVPLPWDVLRIIATLLPVQDLKRLIRSSRALHSAGAPVLYRSVQAWFDPIDWIHVRVGDNRPAELLLTIINSSLPNRFLPSRCYACHIVTLCYGSWCLAADFRGLPLLAEALRFTMKLRHLRIDVGAEAIPLFLDIFRRSSIIITPSSTITHMSVDARPLPCLESVRSSRIAVVEALMHHRTIRSAVVNLAVDEASLTSFLRGGAPWNPAHLRRLSLSVLSSTSSVSFIEPILAAFPRLQHLALRMPAMYVVSYMPDLVAILAVTPLCPSLRTLGINHGGASHFFAPSLQDLKVLVTEGCADRIALREVVMGGSMWMREDEYSEWTFTSSVAVDRWPWLLHRSEGEWGRQGYAVKTARREAPFY